VFVIHARQTRADLSWQRERSREGGIKKPQSLGWAVAAVDAGRQSRLDTL
jgi:hypothetical protein